MDGGLGKTRLFKALPRDGRALQLDGIAVWITKIDRGPVSICAVQPSRLVRLDAEARQVCANRCLIETRKCQREMVHVSGIPYGLAAAGFSEWRGDVDQVDQAASRAELYESDLFQTSFDRAAKYVSIELDRSFQVRNAQYDVIEALRLDDVQAAVLGCLG